MDGDEPEFVDFGCNDDLGFFSGAAVNRQQSGSEKQVGALRGREIAPGLGVMIRDQDGRCLGSTLGRWFGLMGGIH